MTKPHDLGDRARIRVLVADDSATVRSALIALLSADPQLLIVGQAADGQEAVDKARTLRPDVITMDISMPRLDGLGATAAIMADAPARVLMVCSVSEERQLDLSFRAMAAGALELIAKPKPGAAALHEWGRKVAEAVRLMAEVPVVRRQPKSPSTAPGTSPTPTRPARSFAAAGSSQSRVDLVGLVASTGGPPALAVVLGALPAGFPVPILIAQHIAAGFTAGLVRWFTQVSKLQIKIAQDGSRPQPGTVYLPPDGCDLEVDHRLDLRTPRSSGLHLPSGNKLFRSIAKNFGARGLGVLLTGMGDDGAQGLLAIRQLGGQTVAQDEQSSVVFGMPQAAQALGAARQVLPLDLIAPFLLDLCGGGRQ